MANDILWQGALFWGLQAYDKRFTILVAVVVCLRENILPIPIIKKGNNVW
jgi:hypothetical protein